MEFVYLIILAASLQNGYKLGFAAIKEDLVQLNDCVCPQYKLTFECTVLGGELTFWKGTLFSCASNRILLRHNEFSDQAGSASGECNNGAIIATSREANAINEGCYTSQLSIEPVTQDMNNKTIVCTNDDESDETNHTITLKLTRDPPPPPRNIYLRSFNQSELTFAWDTVLMSCIAVHYTIIANRSCGLCPSTTPNTFISCTNPIISGDTCRFSVLPVVCGNVNGNESKPLYVSPRVLDPPALKLIPKVFCSDRTMTIDVSFNKSHPFNISNGIDGSANSYTITYSEATSGNVCGSAIIPTSSCDDRECRYLLKIDLSSSCLSSTGSVCMTAFATNVIGNGPNTVPVTFVVPQCDHSTADSGLTAAISTYSLFLLLAGLTIAVLIIILVILVRERVNLRKELEKAKEFSTYEDVDLPQLSEAPKAANIDIDKNISYCPVSRT